MSAYSGVTNDVTIRIVLMLMIMVKWSGEILDVKGALLHGDFEEGKNVYMGIPEGFEKHYDPVFYVLLLLLYGLKQSAMAFWKKLLMAFASISFAQNKADPCLYFAWTMLGLVLWLSWIDNCLEVVGQAGAPVQKAKKLMTDHFDCNIIGNMDDYTGCKLERNHEQGWIKFTQLVVLQSYTADEFNLPKTPADAGQLLLIPCQPIRHGPALGGTKEGTKLFFNVKSLGILQMNLTSRCPSHQPPWHPTLKIRKQVEK
jgi:hypothetical protein